MTMTNEELVEQIQAGVDVQKNMGLLYEQNIKFITLEIMKYCPDYKSSQKGFYYQSTTVNEIEDIQQEVYFALCDAVKDFDCKMEYKFITYAKYKIDNVIRRFKKSHANTKRLPENMVIRISEYKKYYKQCIIETHERPTEQMVMKHMQLSQVQYDRMMKAIIESECISTSQAIGEEGLTIEDVVADSIDLESTVLDEVFQEQVGQELWDEVKKLDGKQSTVILEKYQEGKTVEAIASDIDVSGTRARQIEQKALKALKQKRNIIRLAKEFGYGGAYHNNSFRHTGTSSTEFVAMKHIEIENRMKKVDDEIQELMTELYS